MNNINDIIKQSSNLRILYVEDNESARESTLSVFEEFFGEIIVAVDGEDGYSKFKENQIDMIITDINMPMLNGIEMINKIRATDNDVPVLILSAYGESEYFVQSIKLGVDGYLLKPIDMKQFLGALQKVTKKIKLTHDLQSTLFLSQQYQDAIDKGSIVSKTDVNENIIYVNDEFCRLSGYARGELIGQQNFIVSHPDNPPELYAELRDTIRSKQIWQGVIRNISKSGKSFYSKTIIKPILDLNGEIVEYIALRNDVTDIMSPIRQLEYFIENAKKPLLIMMEIVDYENLRKFYGQKRINQIEKIIGVELFDIILKTCKFKFENIFILDNGKFAIVKDKITQDAEGVIENIKKSLYSVNATNFTIDDSTYDIPIRMSVSFGENVLENCIYGLESLQASKQDFFIANGWR